MNALQQWTDTVGNSFSDLWSRSIDFLPTIIGAIIIILVGSFVAKGISSLFEHILKEFWNKQLRHNSLRSVFGSEETIEKGGWKINVPSAVSTLIYWFLMIVFLMAATEVLNLDQVTMFLNSVLLYLPNVIVAVVILLIGIVLSQIVANVVKHSVGAAKIASSQFLSGIAKWSIMIFAFMAALVQLKVAAELIQILFTGFVAMIALAGGLAFGLGGKEHARMVIDDLKKDISERH